MFTRSPIIELDGDSYLERLRKKVVLSDEEKLEKIHRLTKKHASTVLNNPRVQHVLLRMLATTCDLQCQILIKEKIDSMNSDDFINAIDEFDDKMTKLRSLLSTQAVLKQGWIDDDIISITNSLSGNQDTVVDELGNLLSEYVFEFLENEKNELSAELTSLATAQNIDKGELATYLNSLNPTQIRNDVLTYFSNAVRNKADVNVPINFAVSIEAIIQSMEERIRQAAVIQNEAILAVKDEADQIVSEALEQMRSKIESARDTAVTDATEMKNKLVLANNIAEDALRVHTNENKERVLRGVESVTGPAMNTLATNVSSLVNNNERIVESKINEVLKLSETKANQIVSNAEEFTNLVEEKVINSSSDLNKRIADSLKSMRETSERSEIKYGSIFELLVHIESWFAWLLNVYQNSLMTMMPDHVMISSLFSTFILSVIIFKLLSSFL